MTYSEILSQIDFFAGTNSTTYTVAQKTINVNNGLDRVAYLIQSADGIWDWEDTNNTDLPIVTTGIIAGHQDYSIDTTFIKIKSVFYKDVDNYTELQHCFDKKEFLEITSSDTGIPSKYCIVGNSILLDVYPSESVTAGLKVNYVRNVNYFLTSDTTKTAGFNPQFHKLLPLYGALDWAIAHNPERIPSLKNEIMVLEKSLQDFYSNRDQTVSKRMINKGINTNDYK